MDTRLFNWEKDPILHVNCKRRFGKVQHGNFLDVEHELLACARAPCLKNKSVVFHEEILTKRRIKERKMLVGESAGIKLHSCLLRQRNQVHSLEEFENLVCWKEGSADVFHSIRRTASKETRDQGQETAMNISVHRRAIWASKCIVFTFAAMAPTAKQRQLHWQQSKVMGLQLSGLLSDPTAVAWLERKNLRQAWLVPDAAWVTSLEERFVGLPISCPKLE